MRQFKDSEGRAWTPRMHCGVLRAFENETGIKLLAALHKGLRELAPKVSGNPAPADMLELISGVMDGSLSNTLKLAYHACGKQAGERKLSFEDFCELIDGDTAAPMLEAVAGEVADFFRKAMGKAAAPSPETAAPSAGATSTN